MNRLYVVLSVRHVDCAECLTPGGCEQHRLFRCVACGFVVPWAFGCSDDLPDHCDRCWCIAHGSDGFDEPAFETGAITARHDNT